MENPLAVANFMIQKGIDNGAPLTQMKLQKLIYFAHGWHLALYDEPLVDAVFQAWKYGPVIPSVYHEFKEYGLLGISEQGTELNVSDSFKISWVRPQIEDKTRTVIPLLNKIWEVFGKYNGTQLSHMTHADGSPWRKVYEENPVARNAEIPDIEIKRYFKGMMNA